MHEILQKIGQRATLTLDSLRPGRRSRATSTTGPASGTDNSSSQQEHPITPTITTAATASVPSPPRPAEPAASSLPAHTYATPPTPPSGLATTGSVVHELLKTAGEASDMFLPLKASIVLVVKIWDVCERTVQLKQDFEKLGEKLKKLLEIAMVYTGHDVVDVKLRERLDEIADALQRLAEFVEAKLDRGVTRRAFQSGTDLQEVREQLENVSSLLEVFQFGSNVRIEIRLAEVLSRLSTTEEKLAAKEAVEQLGKLEDDIASALSGRHVKDATYDALTSEPCMEGTRIEIMDKIMKWSRNPKGKSIFWLRGMLGTGKSTIALTVCHRVQADPTVILGGSFFCSRSASSAERRDVKCIIPTLAQLLARQSKDYSVALAAELEHDPDLAYKQVSVQVDRLLLRPLAAMRVPAHPILFVIDALDECGTPSTGVDGDSDSLQSVSALLEELAKLSRRVERLPVKFLVTSRPEAHIQWTPIWRKSVSTITNLHDVDKAQVVADIELYVATKFSKHCHGEKWYTEDDVNNIVSWADGLFIFAATVLRYILAPAGEDRRAERLQRVSRRISSSTLSHKLEEMYLLIMNSSGSIESEENELEESQAIIAIILSTRAPLTVGALSELLQRSPRSLRGLLASLTAVIQVPKDDDTGNLRTLHASFGDFLFSSRAPGHIRLKASLGHDHLAQGCLRRMGREDLCFNVSRSLSSFEPNPPGQHSVIPLSLRYASVQWAHHVALSSEPAIYDGEIASTVRPKLLSWLEVLSVTGEVRRASGLLLIAASNVKTPDLALFLHDANTFVASSRTAIEHSAPHIYLSALPFAPPQSLISHDFAQLYAGTVLPETFGAAEHGTGLVMTLTGHEQMVRSVVYSSDGTRLASASWDYTVRMWDTRTGDETMAPLKHDSQVSCVTFSPDDRRVASGTDGGMVYIWETAIGRPAVQPLHLHRAKVHSVSFSADGRLLATASADGTFCLANALTGESIFSHTLDAEESGEVTSVVFSPDSALLAVATDRVTVAIRFWSTRTNQEVGALLADDDMGSTRRVAFSRDGRFLASASMDSVVRVWDVSARKSIASLHGHTDNVTSVEFSPNGEHLVSASDDHTVRIWNWRADGQAALSILQGHSSAVTTASYSRDGLYIASGSADDTIRIWSSTASESITAQQQAHNGSINAVAVSPDGRLLITGSDDQTIRLWNVQTGEEAMLPLLNHDGKIFSVACSPDGRYIVSCSEDGTLQLWDAQSGQPILAPVCEHDGEVNSVVFSPDGLYVISGSDDETVIIWDIGTGQLEFNDQLECTDRVVTVAYSSDGSLIAAGCWDGTIHVWDADSGDLISSPGEPDDNRCVRSIAFSPDSKRIVAGCDNPIIRIWDARTGDLLLSLQGHDDYVRSVAFSADGELLASGSGDRTVRLWDAASGETIEPVLYGHRDDVRSVAFTPDSKFVVSGSDDRTTRVWDLEAARKLSSQQENDPLARLALAPMKNGWLVGPSDELLLWVPEAYRAHLQVGGHCTTLIANGRVVLTVNINEYYQGDNWALCARASR